MASRMTREQMLKWVRNLRRDMDGVTVVTERLMMESQQMPAAQANLEIVKIKIVEARMWLGKVLESFDEELPVQFRHKYDEAREDVKNAGPVGGAGFVAEAGRGEGA